MLALSLEFKLRKCAECLHMCTPNLFNVSDSVQRGLLLIIIIIIIIIIIVMIILFL